MKLCGNCRYFPRALSLEDLAFIEAMLKYYKPKTLQDWLRSKNLCLPGAGHRLDPEKVGFVRLNEPVRCTSQHCLVRAHELACYNWKLRESTS